MLKFRQVQQVALTADELVRGLLKLSETEHVSILDSCGVGHLGSHLLIAGIDPLAVQEHDSIDGEASLAKLQSAVDSRAACIFTISYDLGRKLQGLTRGLEISREPDAFIAHYGALIVHDYDTGETRIGGSPSRWQVIEEKLCAATGQPLSDAGCQQPVTASSCLSKSEYLDRVHETQELIREGLTYQTNLTQQISVTSSDAGGAFAKLRRDHPAPFAAYIKRLYSTVVSASPERFFRTDGGRIETSPIKGTRRRGMSADEDESLRYDLRTSTKDCAENTMIVDLLRNDLGRVCEYGSVRVDRLCELEEHPTLFHLVSTVSGDLRGDANFADIVRALFPCGSITGAPKINTMRIIDELEPTPRGLSMGAIGYSIPHDFYGLEPTVDLSVAIRTIVFRGQTATFNVGGGITIDSDPEQEYEESLLKAKALLSALDAHLGA